MKKNQTQDRFPDEKTLKRIREKLSDPDYEGGNIALPEDATPTDKAKYQLCQLIARYKRKHNLLQKEIAKKIGVDESRTSEILRCKIDSFTLDRLVKCAGKLHESLEIKIIAA